MVAEPAGEFRRRVEILPLASFGKIFGGIYPDGTFALPGGGIEEGETPEQAASRELLEETGLRAEQTILLPFSPVRRLWEWDAPARKAHPGFDGSETLWVLARLESVRPGPIRDPWKAWDKQFWDFDTAIRLLEKAVTPFNPTLVQARARVLRHVAKHFQPA